MNGDKQISTVAKGNAFRDHIAQLLRTEHNDVETERRFSGTAVDITFTVRTYDSVLRYAVECKDYGGPLTKVKIAGEIWPQYQLMLTNRDVDKVMIVSRHPVGVDATEWLASNPACVHLTEQVLIERLLGLDDYVNDLAVQPAVRDGEYVEARVRSVTDGSSDKVAIEYVREWLVSPGAHGLAVLGGYGRGKSSFANRVVQEQANLYRANKTQRLPVIIRLGQEVHEVALEGLFGKEFTARNHARSYHFRKIALLNQLGRLLVVLDGFDEMKHAMTYADFLTNFKQINRLLVGNAKVLLLGRPSALSSETHELVLKGNEFVDGQWVMSKDFTGWKQVAIEPFNEGEALLLLTSCLTSATANLTSTRGVTYESRFVQERSQEIAHRLAATDLLTRPVHVNLIAGLGADPDFSFDGFNEYQLYRHFISKALERDVVDKPARKHIGAEPRRKFLRELAWWAWNRPGNNQGQFARTQIPQTIMATLPKGNAQDFEGLLNEYIVTALTEEKEAGTMYFGHRSYQEFLVAEQIIEEPITSDRHVTYSAACTPEILHFIRLGLPDDAKAEWCRALDSCAGPLNPAYVAAFQEWHEDNNDFAVVQLDHHKSMNYAVRIFHTLLRHANHPSIPASVVQWLLRVVLEGNTLNSSMAIIAINGLVSSDTGLTIARPLVAAVLQRCMSIATRTSTEGMTLLVDASKSDAAVSIVRRVFQLDGDKELFVHFNTGSLRDHTLQWMARETRFITHEHAWAVGVAHIQPVNVRVRASDVYGLLPDALRTGHHSFLFPRVTKTYSVSTTTVQRSKLDPDRPT